MIAGFRRVTSLFVLAAAGLAGGCNGSGSGAAPRGDDGSVAVVDPAPGAVTTGPAASPTERHPLAGKWSGHKMTPRFGMVVGAAEIGAEGRGTGVVTARGLTFTAALTIESWDGEWIELSVDGDTYTLRVSASATGDRLEADLPMVGVVVLTRAGVR